MRYVIILIKLLCMYVGKLSFPSLPLRVRQIEYQPVWLGLGGTYIHLCRVASNTV